MLLSYFYFSDKDIVSFAQSLAPVSYEIMADSGGFSAWSLGKEIDLDGYIGWLHRWKDRLFAYAVLDDLRDPVKTWEAQQEMERNGLDPLPVFHYGEDFAWLKRYLDRYRLIMLGGTVAVPWQRAMPWFIKCFKMAGAHNVYHGLGVSSKEPLNALPFYSADASTFLSAARFGRIELFDDRIAQWHTVSLYGRDVTARHLSLLRRYGISESDLRRVFHQQHQAHVARKHGAGVSPRTSAINSVNAAAWLLYEAWLRQRHGQVSWRHDVPTGLRYYLACSGNYGLPWSPSCMGHKLFLATGGPQALR